MNGERPILVTGIPRSGTSWVGKMLDAGGEVVYINEPLSDHRPPGRSPGVLAAPVTIASSTSARPTSPLPDGIRRDARPSLPRRAELRGTAPARRGANGLLEQLHARETARPAPAARRPVRSLLGGLVADRLDCQVVVTVRHPAANAASRKRLGWRTDFRHLLNQPLLIGGFTRSRRRCALWSSAPTRSPRALLWRMAYHVVARLRERGTELRVVRHEDLSHDPLGILRALRRAAPEARRSLPAGDRELLERRAEEAIPGRSPEACRGRLSSLDSRANAVKWKSQLAPAEVARVS